MSDIRVDLDSVQVVEGQGLSEDDFELRVQVQEGSHNLVWPSLNGWIKLDKNGPPMSVNQEIAVYPVSTGKLSKRYNIELTEVDGGLNGQNDIGEGAVTIDLTPDMAPAVVSTTIPLKRPNGKFQGKVKVTLAAQRTS
ncbi:MAG TPA: hypothetical protein VGK64_20700 [Bryobacteraceae bacterium]